ncbi:MAG: FAD-binding oxidoreductase [Pseudomonadota bacterium]
MLSRLTEMSDCRSKDALWPHNWGYADSRLVVNDDGTVSMTGNRYPLCGYKMPYFLPYVEEYLRLKIDWRNPQQELRDKPITEPRHNNAFCKALEQHFSADQYSFSEAERLRHSHGQAIEEVYLVLYEHLPRVVDMVFYCSSEDDAQTLVRLATQHDVCLVPYGGGTNVSCALELPKEEPRMTVAVNTLHMNRVEWIDEENLRACVQSGITGMELEDVLGRAGFTCGHAPDSIELSTLGGWIATCASGMKKNRYGNIEDIVEKFDIVTPTGKPEQLQPTPRASIGMQPQRLLFGSEGNLGIITKAIIRIHRKPEAEKYASLVFPSFERGVEFMYELAHSGLVPASVRLVDNTQFRLSQALKPATIGWQALAKKLQQWYLRRWLGFDPKRLAAMTVVMEGSVREVAYQQANLKALAKRFGAVPGGATNGRYGYLLTFATAYLASFLIPYRIIGETLETTVPWNKIRQVCDGARATIQAEHRRLGLPGQPFLTCRISQVYHTGVCVYLLFVISTGAAEQPVDCLVEIERALRRSVLENGGSLSHHHGIGKIRRDFMPETLAPAGIQLLKNVKKSLDPTNVFAISNNVLNDD